MQLFQSASLDRAYPSFEDNVTTCTIVSLPSSVLATLSTDRCLVMRPLEDDCYEIAIDDRDLPPLEDSCHPTQEYLLEEQIDYQGKAWKRESARREWFRWVRVVLTDLYWPAVIREAYLAQISSRGLSLHFQRWLLLQDLSSMTDNSRRKLAQYLVLLRHKLGPTNARCDQYDPIPDFHSIFQWDSTSLPSATADIQQSISLGRGLLSLSGVEVDHRLHMSINMNYSAVQNADLCRLLSGIERSGDLGHVYSANLQESLRFSPFFSEEERLNLHEMDIEIVRSLHIGVLPSLNLPADVLKHFRTCTVLEFETAVSHLRQFVPQSAAEFCGTAMLFTFCEAHGIESEQDLLQSWAKSVDGCGMFNRLLAGLACSQSPEQLALRLAALVGYCRFCPDQCDHQASHSTSCHLSDLDALINGQRLANSRRVAGCMLRALVRCLQPREDLRGLMTYLAEVLDRPCQQSHRFEWLCNEYMCIRAKQRTLPYSHVVALGLMESRGLYTAQQD